MATRSAGKRKKSSRRWSARVTSHSNALDLDRDVFTWKDPRRIARSLKRSAERSHRRKSEPYRSAMSMLTFYVNRAGHNLSATQLRVLERAKAELRALYGKTDSAKTPAKKTGNKTAKKTARKKTKKRRTAGPKKR